MREGVDETNNARAHVYTAWCERVKVGIKMFFSLHQSVGTLTMYACLFKIGHYMMVLVHHPPHQLLFSDLTLMFL